MAEAEVVKIFLSDKVRGYFETSPRPCGKWKCYWTMTLKRRYQKCRLPRGF